jgi:ribonuclease HI
MRIEIYIQTKTKNPAVQKTAQARWLIYSVSNNGQVSTKDGIVAISNATSKRAALQSLVDALSRFNKAAVIKIYISDDYVRNMCLTQMPVRWRANDWHKIRQNGELKHCDLWQRVNSLLANHAVVFATGAECSGSYKLKELEDRLNGIKRML